MPKFTGLRPMLGSGEPWGPHVTPVLGSSFTVKERKCKGSEGGADESLRWVRKGGFESDFDRWIRSGILGGRSHWQRLRGRKSRDTWRGTMYHRPTESASRRGQTDPLLVCSQVLNAEILLYRLVKSCCPTCSPQCPRHSALSPWHLSVPRGPCLH